MLAFKLGYAQESVTWGVETTAATTTTKQFMAEAFPPGILISLASGTAWTLGDSDV